LSLPFSYNKDMQYIDNRENFKLKITFPLDMDKEPEICSIDCAHTRINYDAGHMVIVGGMVIGTHQELVELAKNEQHRGKDIIEVMVVPFIEAG